MNERCATCRWWDDDETNIPSHEPDIVPGWGRCLRTHGPHAVDSMALTVSVTPSTLVPLYTTPDFGCVQWSAGNEE